MLLGRVVDHERTDPAGFGAALSPPHTSGPDRTRANFVDGPKLRMQAVDLLAHAIDQGTRLILPVRAPGFHAPAGKSKLAFGLRSDGVTDFRRQGNWRRNGSHHAVSSDDADDLGVRRLAGRAGADRREGRPLPVGSFLG